MDAIQSLNHQIEKIDNEIKELLDMEKSLPDEEMRATARIDIESLTEQKSHLVLAIQSMQGMGGTPSSNKGQKEDPTLSNICIMEIRAGTGGDEAGLFAHNLFDMYTKFAEIRKWKVNLISKNEGGIGNFKEVVFEITGNNPTAFPYKQLEYESGTHRVQRIPVTETGGRIHTSTATVAVLPLVKNVTVEIRPEDLRVDTYRAGGAGGQHVNKTESAIRITHLPTGIVVQCQDERSQHKNRDKAMGVLKSKISDLMRRQEKQSVDDIRSDQVGTGERSEKIRTYNYPQDRVTDHRIKKSWFGMERIMAGEISDILADTRNLIDNPVTSLADSDDTEE